MSKTVFIYALNCPITGRTRYVGKANNPARRLSSHLADNCKENNRRVNWIRSLLTKGLAPVLEILDEVSADEWQAWEVAWIAFFREEGFDLVNGTAGGDGMDKPSDETRAKLKASHSGENHHFFGKHHSSEHCAAISASHKGKWAGKKHPNYGKPSPFKGVPRSPEVCAKISAGNLGKKKSPEHCAAMRANHADYSGEKNPNYGKSQSVETRAKISQALTGRTGHSMSEETKRKVSEANTGNTYALGCVRSAETRAKISAAKTGVKRSPEACAAISAGIRAAQERRAKEKL